MNSSCFVIRTYVGLHLLNRDVPYTRIANVLKEQSVFIFGAPKLNSLDFLWYPSLMLVPA